VPGGIGRPQGNRFGLLDHPEHNSNNIREIEIAKMLEKVMKHRHGDTREDGYRFWGYHPGCTNGESWYSPEQWERAKETDLKRRREVSEPRTPKRMTVPTPKFGDTREDGYRFHGFDHKGRELWKSPEAWLRVNPSWGKPKARRDEHHKHIRHAFHNTRKRAKANGLPFDLTYEFLLEIFPTDGLCKLTRELMVWGMTDGISNSPSVDRLDASKGYTKDNVWFISHKANRDKWNTDKAYPPFVNLYENADGGVVTDPPGNLVVASLREKHRVST